MQKLRFNHANKVKAKVGMSIKIEKYPNTLSLTIFFVFLIHKTPKSLFLTTPYFLCSEKVSRIAINKQQQYFLCSLSIKRQKAFEYQRLKHFIQPFKCITSGFSFGLKHKKAFGKKFFQRLLEKKGSYLLSRIALQYHRRKRA